MLKTYRILSFSNIKLVLKQNIDDKKLIKIFLQYQGGYGQPQGGYGGYGPNQGYQQGYNSGYGLFFVYIYLFDILVKIHVKGTLLFL